MQHLDLTPLAQIATLAGMRRYTTPIARIESLPEMKAALDQELERVRRRHGLKEDDRAIFERHLALYIMAYYFDRDAGERDRIVEEGRRIMEERRRSPKPVYWDIEADAGPESQAPAVTKGHDVGPGSEPGPRRRRQA